jgi:hypothetical protein
MLCIRRALRSDANATFDMRMQAMGHQCVTSCAHEQQQVRV